MTKGRKGMTETGSADHVSQRLSLLANEWPALKKAARLYEAIIPVLATIEDAEAGAGRVSITAAEAQSRMAEGMPLLQGVELELDALTVRDLMIQLARAAEKMEVGPAGRIRLALENDILDIAGLIPSVIAGDKDAVTTIAQNLQLDPGLVLTLAANAIKPAMRAWCSQLKQLAEGIPWDEGYCFVCGAYALLGELRDDNQVKHLRCGRCGADWRVRRLQCAYCGNDDHHTLGYLYPEGRPEKIQAETCDKCGGYLKVITSFASASPSMLAVEDLSTLHLDFIAKDRGYARRSGLLE